MEGCGDRSNRGRADIWRDHALRFSLQLSGSSSLFVTLSQVLKRFGKGCRALSSDATRWRNSRSLLRLRRKSAGRAALSVGTRCRSHNPSVVGSNPTGPISAAPCGAASRALCLCGRVHLRPLARTQPARFPVQILQGPFRFRGPRQTQS